MASKIIKIDQLKDMAEKQKNRKVDVVVKYFFPLTAGIETNVLNVYGYMVENGWKVNVHTTTDMPGAPNSLPQNDNVRGINVSRYKWNWWGFMPKINWGKTDAVCLHNFDIFPHSWILIYAGIRRSLGLKTPKIFLTPHGGYTIATGWHTYPLWQRVIKKTYQNTLGTFLINNIVDGYRSVSAWEGEETIKNGINPQKVHIITNGIESEAYMDIDKLASSNIKKTVKRMGIYVLQIGRIHPIKNQETTIKAMTKVPYKVKLAIVGPITDYIYHQKLLKLIDRLKLNNRVQFLGVISGIDKYYLLKHCLAYSHMSVWESYCNTVHEAMSQGAVSIVSKDTALEELVKNGYSGFTAGVTDDKAVAQKVNYVLNNQTSILIKKIKKNAHKFTEGHSWQEISKQVAEMYNRYI